MAEVIQINENTWRVEDGMVRFFVLEGTEKALMSMRVSLAICTD